MAPTVTIVIPVYNAASYLTASLGAIRVLDPAPLECLVVDDGSTDGSAAIARQAGIPVLSAGYQRGPAAARNLGARAARGEILLFVDADVAIPPDTIARVLGAFTEDPARDAIIGSYDDRPGDPGFVSQYRNLLHCYTHQNSQPRTHTFWTGCGAIRTSVFWRHNGFSESFTKASLEDMDLGLRLCQSGGRISLVKSLRVKHLKRLGFIDSLRTDIFDRAIPWTLLILQFRSMPADLNLKWTQRVSVALAWVNLGAAAAAALLRLVAEAPGAAWTTLAASSLALAALALLNLRFYRFLAARRGAGFALRSFPMHWLYFFSSGLGFAAGLLVHMLEQAAPSPAPASTESDG
jgi:glycosyltransferase involved in cell wall biosynthesis